jgi:hypothetical protein
MSLLGKLLKKSPNLNILATEPPFRLVTKVLLKKFSAPVEIKSTWDAVSYPQYLVGVLEAAKQAVKEERKEISVVEFGVAWGKGLMALQGFAEAVEKELGVHISVFGFDTGLGLPDAGADYRNHPDIWKAGDFPMDESRLKQQLSSRTRLVLGDVAETVPEFVQHIQPSAVGFISIDVDYYTSTLSALRMLTLPGKQMLRVVPMYFDDVYQMSYHRFAGELAAIDEFNRINELIKIDRWRDIETGRAFPHAAWLKGMYLAHDLGAISNVNRAGPASCL